MAFTIQADLSPLERQIDRVIDDLRDPSWLFDIIRREFLIPRLMNVFDTDGKGTWLPTTRPNPILRDTRALERSYTQEGAPGNVNIERGTTLTWGSEIPYSVYHEFGTAHLPIRAVVGLLAGNPEEEQILTGIIERAFEERFRSGV